MGLQIRNPCRGGHRSGGPPHRPRPQAEPPARAPRACSQHMDANAKNTRCPACFAKQVDYGAGVPAGSRPETRGGVPPGKAVTETVRERAVSKRNGKMSRPPCRAGSRTITSTLWDTGARKALARPTAGRASGPAGLGHARPPPRPPPPEASGGEWLPRPRQQQAATGPAHGSTMPASPTQLSSSSTPRTDEQGAPPAPRPPHPGGQDRPGRHRGHPRRRQGTAPRASSGRRRRARTGSHRNTRSVRRTGPARRLGTQARRGIDSSQDRRLD